MKTLKEQREAIAALLAKFDRYIAESFLESVKRIQDGITLSEIEAALRSNNPLLAQELVTQSLVRAAYIPFGESLQDAMIAGGQHAKTIASAHGVEFAFQVGDTNAARFLSNYLAEKIQAITDETKRTIGQIAVNGVNAGINPRDTARTIRASLGLTSHQEGIVANYRTYLMEGDRRALENRLRDARYDPTVARSIKEGTPLSKERIDQMVDRYRSRLILRRSETIARTESMTLIHGGQDAYWRQLVASGDVSADQIKRKWITTNDSRLRDAHAAIPSLNKDGRGYDEPFLSPLGLIRYPCDPAATPANRINCRCSLFVRID